MSTAFKCLIFFLLLTVNLSILTTFIKAEYPEAINKDNYTAEIHSTYSIDNITNSGLCLLAGMSPVGKCPGRYRDKNGDIKLVLYNQIPGGGAVGSLTNAMTAMLVTPPTSTTLYLANIGQDLGFYKAVHAQGVTGSGAGIIEPVRILWQVVRNLVYLFFIVIFIAVGFMIMFRQKLNPQTIITAQAALPGLVVGLILVTFSYFISALIIDSSFLGIKLLTEIFVQVKVDGGPVLNAFGDEAGLRNLAEKSNLLNLFTASAFRGENISDVFTSGYDFTLNTSKGLELGTGAVLIGIVTAIIGLIIGLTMGPIGAGVGLIVGGAAGPLVGPAVLSLLVPLILIIALFVQFFKLLFKLIGAYIAILVSTITAPFIILFSSLPGRGGVLSVWWKTLLGNALIFPAVFGAFLFAGMILATSPGSWRASPPLFGGLSTELLRLIVAYGILLGSPAIPDMVKKALGVPDIQGIPQAAMAGAMGGFGIGRASTTKGWGALTAPTQRIIEERAKLRAQIAGGTVPPTTPAPPVFTSATGSGPVRRFRNWWVNRH